MTTFEELGIPFPLFEAPAEEAVKFRPRGHCSVCWLLPTPCFRFGLGSNVIVRCRSCKTPHALDAFDQERTFCRSCGRKIRFPRFEELWDFIGPKRKQTIDVCYDCFRSGRGAVNKLTEYGVVTWESAQQGLIDGVPEDAACPLRIVNLGWARRGARADAQALVELVHTPTYCSWATPVWLFCCGEPMVYAGAWSKEQLQLAASDGDGKVLLANTVTDRRSLVHDVLWHDGFGYSPRVYVFRCPRCGRLRANWDQAPALAQAHRVVRQ